uniref:WD40 repeat n=1 Tax=Candidatus Kentrum sp. TUN TaxID=2126343 RepID=A0A450ZM50_9GAMM|nr:MAG: WD40 repeat [Candidatus Kentron sp. TUN]VFK59935.1 MAG: WD40 repeat [Candidatus Kentron sp. TUN]
MQRIEEYAIKIHAKHALFLFDSCFSGSLFNITRSAPKNISDKTGKPVRQFITAGSADERVPDRSIFREQFIAALKGEGDMNKDGFVTGAELGEFLHTKVVNYSKGSQHPQYGKIRNADLDKGDFVFVSMKPIKSNAAPSGSRTISVDPSAMDFEFWNAIKQSKEPELYRAYLKQFPNGTFAAIARIRIKELAGSATVGWAKAPPGAVPITNGEMDTEGTAMGTAQDAFAHPTPAQLTIRSNVTKDTVTIDGKNVGPTGPRSHKLSPGEHTVRVEKKGFEPFETTIRLAAGEEETVRAQLKSTAPNYANWRVLRKIQGHYSGILWPGYGIQFSPDRRALLLTNATLDNLFQLWDIQTGEMIRTFKGHSEVIWSVTFSPDGRRLLSGSRDKTLKLWDVASGREIRTFKGHSAGVLSVAFSPDGRRALSGSYDETLKLWDVASGRELRTFKGHSNTVHSVAFSPDGQSILSGSDDKTLKLWDVASGKAIRTFEGHSGQVTFVAFALDGRSALSGGPDDTPKLRDVASGNEIRTFKGHSTDVNSVAFAPDGHTLLSGSDDKTIKLWDVASGREIRTLKGHSDDVNSVAFSPDGQRAASGDSGGVIILWGEE